MYLNLPHQGDFLSHEDMPWFDIIFIVNVHQEVLENLGFVKLVTEEILVLYFQPLDTGHIIQTHNDGPGLI
jgi:ABC-type proline/glycine betaine transport system substrate-binding protein